MEKNVGRCKWQDFFSTQQELFDLASYQQASSLLYFGFIPFVLRCHLTSGIPAPSFRALDFLDIYRFFSAHSLSGYRDGILERGQICFAFGTCDGYYTCFVLSPSCLPESKVDVVRSFTYWTMRLKLVCVVILFQVIATVSGTRIQERVRSSSWQMANEWCRWDCWKSR